MQPLFGPVPLGRPSFLNVARCLDVELFDADIGIIGVPYTTPADLVASRQPSSTAPAAIREQSLRYASLLDAYDFEFGGPLFGNRSARIMDLGDVAGRPGAFAANEEGVTAAVRAVLERGALPVVLGGDGAATLPVLQAFSAAGVCAVRLGARLGWVRGVVGVTTGAASGMRRAAELPHVVSVAQVGLRGVGPDRATDVADATAAGAVLVRAEEVHRDGVEAALVRLPGADRYYVSIDASAFDPAVAPGVETPAFGGLTYFEVANLLKGIASRGAVVGLDIVGVVPANDLNNVTSLLAARTVLNVLGWASRREHEQCDSMTTAPAGALSEV